MSYKNSASLLKTAIILLFILLNLFIPAQRFSSGDVNPPVDKGNSWWNTTAGSNWVINTTGNIWVNKNISVGNSLEIANGGNLLFQNCTVIINNNLTVDYNATLILINTTILFNCSINGSSKFTVKRGGSLNISDFDNDSKTSHDASIINSKVSDNKHRYIFIISKGANFTMLNSELHQCGFSFAPTYYGLYIKADNSTLENNSFSMNYGGLIIESSNNSIKNNKVFNNDEYGLLIIMGKNNTLQNNTLVNNKYNFGLFLNDLNQDNNITLDNEINGKDICYTEKTENLTIDSVFSNAGFIGIVNSSNISVKDQYLNKNFNSLLLFSVNDIIFKNTSISHNYYGLFANNAQNIIFEDSNITNNSQIGFELFNFCQDFKIIGCNFKNNFIGIQVSNSNLTLINTTFFNSSNNDIFLRTTSEVNAINCSFNKNKIKFGSGISTFITKYYLNVQTKNHTGHSIGNVPISIYDGKDKLVYFGKSNNKGYLNWIPCVSYILKKTGINLDMSEHKIVVNYAGLEFVKYVNITQFSKTILFLNHPPKILNHPSKLVYINEDTKFYYDFEGYDIDFDNISWKSVTNASWINNINQTTGLIYGTPSDPDIGIFYLNISCNDNYSGYDYYNFTIVVNNTNDCPKIISKEGSGIAYEDILYIHDFNVTDPDRGDSHNWSMITDADWLLPIHKYLGKIIGRPSQDDVGKYYVNITCTDRLGSFDYYNYTLTVLAMNDRPVIINPPDKVVNIKEDTTFYYNFDYYDQDLDPVTWMCHTNAFWLNEINATSGELEGIPGDFDVKKFFVNVSCKDPGNFIAYYNFTIKVENTNDPPQFSGEIPKVLYAVEDDDFEHEFRITDLDKKDSFKYNLDFKYFDKNGLEYIPGNLWLQISSGTNSRSCILFGKPKNDDVGKLVINLTVQDNAGARDNITFKILVNNTNDPPEILNPAPKLVYIFEDSEFYYDFNYIDIDGDTVTWSIKTNAQWLTEIDNITGEISGIPKQEDLGISYFINVECMDRFGGSDSQNFSAKINNTNDPPIILNPCTEIVYVNEDEYYEYDFNSIDKDSKNVYWSSYSNASWLEPINVFTGLISGIPFDNDVGEYFVNISCGDDLNYYCYWNFTIIVNNINDPPLIRNWYLAPISVYSGEEYYFKFMAKDPDGDAIIWEMNTNASSWLYFDNNTGILSGTPNRFDIGIYYVNLTCYDQFGAMDFYLFDLNVKGIYNRPPELMEGHVDPVTGDNKTIFTFHVTYRDMDYDEPYSVWVKIDDQPYTMTFVSGNNISTGILFRYQTCLEKGNHTYYFQAMDMLYSGAVINDYTPSFKNPEIIVVHEPEEEIGSKEDMSQFQLLLIIILTIMIILVLFGIVYKNKHKLQKRTTIDDVSESSLESEVDEPVEEIELDIEEEPKTGRIPKKVEGQLKSKQPVIELGKVKIEEKSKTKITVPSIEELGFTDELDDVITREPEDNGILEHEHEYGHVDEYEDEHEHEHEHDILICPECGEFVNETYSTCPGCGVRFIMDAPESDETQLDFETIYDQGVEREDLQEHDILICPECGEFVNETYSACPGCGVNFIFEGQNNGKDNKAEKQERQDEQDSHKQQKQSQKRKMKKGPKRRFSKKKKRRI